MKNDKITSDTYLFRRFTNYLLYKKKLLGKAFIFLILATGLALIGPYIMAIALDDFIILGKKEGILPMALIYFLVYFLRAIALFFMLWNMSNIGYSIIYKLRKDTFDHLQEIGMKYYNETPHGDIISRVMQDTSILQGWFSGSILYSISGIFFTLAAFIIMIFISPFLTLISLVIIPFIFLVTKASQKYARVAWSKTRVINSKITSNMTENIMGIRVSQSYARKQENIHNFEKINKEYFDAWQRAIRVDAPIFYLYQLLAIIGSVLIYYFGGLMVMENRGISVGIFFLFISYQTTFIQHLTGVADFYSITQSAFAAFERVILLQDTIPSVPDKTTKSSLQVDEGKIEFKDISFAYKDGDNVLNNFNLQIQPKQTLAIVGTTGSGKTTIVNLLIRLYDIQSGEILIDNQNINSVNLNSLRGNIGMVIQEPFLFSSTIRDNICYGKKINDEEIMEILVKIGADFVLFLSDGLDTVVGERGIKLSIGQRQLITIARALALEPKILLLDEATSSIDSQTELIIQRNLPSIIKDRTSIIIAHRLSTIRNVDRIVVMDNGKIIEDGTFNELYEQQGKFYELYKLQIEI